MNLPRFSEQQPLITYQIEDTETVIEGINEAFGAIGLNGYNQETTIEDWTPNCLVDLGTLDSIGPCRVSTVIWEHPVVITPGKIRLYEHP